MPSLSTAEYEIFKKLVKKTLDSRYFNVRKELLTFDRVGNDYSIILEHGLYSDDVIVNIDYHMEGSVNNKTTNFSVSRIDENKILVKCDIAIDFYVTVQSNVFMSLSQANLGTENSIKCGEVITSPDTICGDGIIGLDTNINTLLPVPMF